MKKFLALGLALLFLAGPSLVAQEGSPGGDLLALTTFRVQPGDGPRYEAAVAKIVQAANEAGLAADYGWRVWGDLSTYLLVYPFETMAYWDNRGQWMRQFEGTPGEATLQEAFEMLGSIETETLEQAVVERVPNWSYRLDAMGTEALKMAHLDEVWIKAGKEMALDSLNQEWVAFLEQIEYPYTMLGHRQRFGGEARQTFAVLFDTKEAFYGVNDLERITEQHGAGKQMEDLISKYLEIVRHWEHRDIEYKPNMSYQPGGQVSAREQ